MIERIRTKSKNKVGKFYDRIYEKGGYISGSNFNRRALKILGLKKENARLLDVGCGQGTLLAAAEKYVETYGVDISKEAIKKAEKISGKSKFRVAEAEKIPFPSGYFDYITCMGSLEHFVDINKALKEMRRVAKKGAKILIHVPNSRYLVHKILGINTQGQINERLATEEEWRSIIGKYFVIEKAHKYNTRFFLEWIPKRYCCHFTFLCRKNHE
ncbi:MAG: class I SAM-dependent methyltransferase [Candidatus Aenigmarchaeota archaeon]|nr:class I SAM-dependent methyltransferase [Candidatus Aenigmarchaeota archaeon]